MNKKGTTAIAIIALVLIVVIAGFLFFNSNKNQSTNKQNSAGANVKATSGNKLVVEISSSGFSPNKLEIKQGETVTWTNKDSAGHWPASALHPSHKVYPESTGKCALIGGSDFDSCGDIKTGESWSFKFNAKGSWGYHDHSNVALRGQIVVS